MMRYQLTAESSKAKEIVEFNEDDDGAAMMTAMFSHILATGANPVWGVGIITLRNLTTGEIVNTMDSKE